MRQQSHSLSAGQTLYHAGEPAEAVYLIDSGIMDLFVEGTSEPIRSAMPGEVLGILAIMSNGCFIRTARARGELVFFRIRREEFLDYLRQNPGLWLQVLAMLDREANNALASLTRCRARASLIASAGRH